MSDGTQAENGNTPELRSFAEVVRQYDQWAREPIPDPQDDLRRARALLAELHGRILRVSMPSLENEPDVDAPDQDERDLEMVRRRFQRLPFDVYFGSLESQETKAPELAGFYVSGDLEEIWGDLVGGLWLHDAGYPALAAFEWRMLFDTHWGRHLVDAARAIHHYVQDVMGS